MEKLKRFYKAIKMELREHKRSFFVYLILRILVIVVLWVQIHERNFESVFLSILTLWMLLIPSIVQVTFRIELPTVLESIILLFIFAAQILGEINGFYVKIPFWDTMLHTLNGFLAAAIGFSLVDILNKSEKLVFNLSPFFAVMVVFLLALSYLPEVKDLKELADFLEISEQHQSMLLGKFYKNGYVQIKRKHWYCLDLEM